MELFNENSKLAEIIHKDPSLLPVINRFGIKLGFGDRTVGNICTDKNIDINFFIETINVFHFEGYFPEKRLLDFSIKIVIDYLVKTHQYYLNYLIPENDRLIELFLSSTNSESTENSLVKKFYSKFKDEFLLHINFEEKEMFPYILELDNAISNNNNQKFFAEKYKGFSIDGFEKEHSNMDDKMDDLKNIIIKYLPPNYDQNRGNTFLANIFSFEKDLTNHSRIEDNILIPKVKQLEKIVFGNEK